MKDFWVVPSAAGRILGVYLSVESRAQVGLVGRSFSSHQEFGCMPVRRPPPCHKPDVFTRGSRVQAGLTACTLSSQQDLRCTSVARPPRQRVQSSGRTSSP